MQAAYCQIAKARVCYPYSMSLSWSHTIFFRINRSLGERPWFDAIMVFAATWVLYFLLGIFLFSIVFLPPSSLDQELFLALAGFSFAAAYAISYCIALVWPHRRPASEFPTIKQLIQPIGRWKSFPSDHTIAVTIVAALAWILWKRGLWGWPVPVLYTAFGFLVASARVYVGVHYPRDILGGILVGIISVLAMFSFAPAFFWHIL